MGVKVLFSVRVDDKTCIELLHEYHKEELYELVDRNREYLREWLLWVDKRQSAADFEPVIRLWLQNYAENNGFDAGVRYDGKLVGMVSLQAIDWKNRITSLGYFLGEEVQGKGIITNCVRVLLGHAFSDMKLNKVVIQCASGNTRSRSIPERLGFSPEGISRDGQWLYDHYVDLVNYSLLRREWEEQSK